MKKACVIGWPIKHSRSPFIHNYWINAHNIDAIYERRTVEPKDLHQFIRNLAVEGYVGCNVTIPHKELALTCVDAYDQIVQKTGALNTIYFDQGKIMATTTDGDGFLNNVNSIVPNFSFQDKTLLLLGAGGSAKSVCERLLCKNAKAIFVVNRTTSRILELQNLFGEKVKSLAEQDLPEQLAKSDMLINTTSQGMRGQPALDIDLKFLPKNAVVADIVYVPLKTNLILQAEALGLKTVPGLGMLLHQAVEGFERWFGVRPQVTQELYDLVAQDIMADQST